MLLWAGYPTVLKGRSAWAKTIFLCTKLQSMSLYILFVFYIYKHVINMYLGLLALHTTVCGLVSCRFCSLLNALFGGDDWLAFQFKSLFGAERKIVEIERSHGFDFLLQHFHTWDGPRLMSSCRARTAISGLS